MGRDGGEGSHGNAAHDELVEEFERRDQIRRGRDELVNVRCDEDLAPGRKVVVWPRPTRRANSRAIARPSASSPGV